jgi:hypothetical protein
LNAPAKLGERSKPVRNKSIIAALVAALLAACSSSNVTPPLAPSQNLSRIVQVPVRGATSRHIAISSVFGALNIGGVVHKEIINGSCMLYRRHGFALGCHVISAANLFVRRSSFLFYTGTSGTGCNVATGHFRGRIFRGSSIPIVFRWTGNC